MVAAGCLFLCLALGSAAQAVTGIVRADGGSWLHGVTVSFDGTNVRVRTDQNGSFATELPAGTYDITLTRGNSSRHLDDVPVNHETPLVLVWEMGESEEITVWASRRPQKRVEAPAAVTVIDGDELRDRASTGQVPKALEFTPGVEIAQGSAFDFNVNARGFNTSRNRRVLTLIDGRNPAIPSLGSQEWASFPYPLDEIGSIEFVRGPSSALYGANAFNGVLNVTTKTAHESPGGAVRLTLGEQQLRRIEGRWGGPLLWGWAMRLTASAAREELLTRSRNVSVEYAGLPRERVALSRGDAQTESFALRVDSRPDARVLMTGEIGTAEVRGPVQIFGTGRTQQTDTDRPWARLFAGTSRWNALAYYNERNANAQHALSSGAAVYEASSTFHLEMQQNGEAWEQRVRWTAGGSYDRETLDSRNPAGAQTSVEQPLRTDGHALFGQLEASPTARVQAVVAARYDDSSLYSSRISPKAAVVLTLAGNQTLRLTYNESFQRPNHAELFLYLPVAAPVDLSAIERLLAGELGGISLGFSSVAVVAAGNRNLEVEEITAWELGYHLALGRRGLLSVDLYRNDLQNFVSDPLPLVATSLGRINPDYQAYRAPSGVRPEVEAEIRRLAPVSLTNDRSGRPILLALTYANFGRVTTHGIDVALHLTPSPSWTVDASSSWMKFDIPADPPDIPLRANAPEFRYALGVSYRRGDLSGSGQYRSSDAFDWIAGVFRGRVPSYRVIDCGLRYQIDPRWAVALQVSNAIDSKHYELFGGDVLRRRSLVSLTWSDR